MLVSDIGVVKLADFGCSRKLHKAPGDFDSACASFGKVCGVQLSCDSSARARERFRLCLGSWRTPHTRPRSPHAIARTAGRHAVLHGARGTGERGCGAGD